MMARNVTEQSYPLCTLLFSQKRFSLKVYHTFSTFLFQSTFIISEYGKLNGALQISKDKRPKESSLFNVFVAEKATKT